MVKDKKIELEQQYVMLQIPKGTLKLEIIATMFGEVNKNTKLVEVSRELNIDEIFQARQDFLEYVGDDFDAVYTLTDEGREYLQSLKEQS